MSGLVRLLIVVRKWRRRPEATGILVSNEHNFARLIAHRVVPPGSQAILVTVDGPRVSAASLRACEAKLRLRDDVAPRGRSHRTAAAVGMNHILATIISQPAEAIRSFQLSPGISSDGSLRRWWQVLLDEASRRLVEQLLLRTRQLIAEASLGGIHIRPGDGTKQQLVLRRQQIGAPQKHAARLVDPGLRRARVDDLLELVLQLLEVACRVLIQ